MAVWSPIGTDGVWDVSMRAGQEVGGNTLGLYGARFGPGGVKIVAHGYQGEVAGKWQGRCIAGGHFGPVTDLTWSPSGIYLISVSCDQTARMWSEWQELSRTQIHGYDLVRCCAISDTMYVSSADEKVVRVFKSPATFIDNFINLTGHAISMPLEAALGATVLALGLSNKAVFKAKEATKIKKTRHFPRFQKRSTIPTPLEETLLQHTLWPEVRKLYGHSFEVFALAVSLDGSLVASAAKATKPEVPGIENQ